MCPKAQPLSVGRLVTLSLQPGTASEVMSMIMSYANSSHDCLLPVCVCLSANEVAARI